MPKPHKKRRRKPKPSTVPPVLPQSPVTAPPRRSLGVFVGLTLLWMVPAFALWYAAGPVVLVPVAWLADMILPGLYPQAIEAVEWQVYALDIVTRFDYTPPDTQLPAGMVGQYIISLNGLKYGYGLPLLLALTLASPSRLRHKLSIFGLSFILITLVQVWGVSFEALITLIFKSEPAIAQQMGSSALSRELLALGYQLGYLILPAVTPLIIWGLSHYAFLQTLLRRPSRDSAVSGVSS